MTHNRKFPLGKFVITPRALRQLETQDVRAGLSRHLSGDWGELSSEDIAANNDALSDGARVLSQYRSAKGVRFWVITEADRSVTTVLLPDDY